MDRFTRNYSIGFAVLALALIAFWIYSVWSPRVWEINAELEKQPAIAGYPYRFRVVSLKDGIATISTPRSFDIPAVRFLAILQPELANVAQDDSRMLAAQQRLIDAQKLAMILVQQQPDVREVRWELDLSWLSDHGVEAPQGRP
jgi:hypothetical protein